MLTAQWCPLSKSLDSCSKSCARPLESVKKEGGGGGGGASAPLPFHVMAQTQQLQCQTTVVDLKCSGGGCQLWCQAGWWKNAEGNMRLHGDTPGHMERKEGSAWSACRSVRDPRKGSPFCFSIRPQCCTDWRGQGRWAGLQRLLGSRFCTFSQSVTQVRWSEKGIPPTPSVSLTTKLRSTFICLHRRGRQSQPWIQMPFLAPQACMSTAVMMRPNDETQPAGTWNGDWLLHYIQ